MYRTVARPKPTKYAALICSFAMISAAFGIVVGLATGNLIWMVLLLFPAAIYEVYRTAGASTKWASWVLLVLLVAEVLLLSFNISFNLAELIGQETAYVGGQWLRLGDIKTVGPTLLAGVSLILMLRTAGIYTRWLASIIFVTSLALIYGLDPELFQELLPSLLRQVVRGI